MIPLSQWSPMLIIFVSNIFNFATSVKLGVTLLTVQLLYLITNYFNSLLLGLFDSQIRKLQRVQNTAARILTKTSKYDHITPILVDLYWLPLKARIEYKILYNSYLKSTSWFCPHLPWKSTSSRYINQHGSIYMDHKRLHLLIVLLKKMILIQQIQQKILGLLLKNFGPQAPTGITPCTTIKIFRIN